MAEPEYPVLKELETKLKLRWVDTDDYMATQRAIIQVEPELAYLELPRGRKGDKGDPGPAISFQGIVASDSHLPANAKVGQAYVNTSTKGIAVWNGSSWFKVNNFAGVDADVQQFSRWFAQIESDTRRAVDAAKRAEFAANETIQQVAGDFATRNYVEDKKWDKGILTRAVDLLSLAPGRYGLMSASVASSMGLPGNSAGVLIVDYLDGPNGRLSGRFWWEYQDRTYGRICYSATSYNGKFSGWQPDNTWHKMPLTTSDKLVELPPGRYPVASEDVAKALGLPWAGMGYLEMEWLGTSAYQRVDWWTGVQPTHHWRISIYNKGWDKAVWEHLHGADTGEGSNYQLAGADAAIEAMLTTNDPTSSFESEHAALVGDLKRRVGPVNVGSAGALALVFDHGTTAFREWIWPELKKRNLVGTMALCPEVHLDDNGDSRHRATNDEIKSWVKDGLVIAGHSGDHEGAKTTTDIYRQIVVSKQALETKLDTKVDCWVQPGYSLADGDYGGFGTGQLASNYTDTLAGRLLQQTYPVITGYVGDDYLYPMQELPVGVQRSLMEKKESVAEVRDYVQQAADQGLKHINFIHPYALADSSDTYATKRDYIDFLDLVAGLRDAGKLKVLTLPQLAIAEK